MIGYDRLADSAGTGNIEEAAKRVGAGRPYEPVCRVTEDDHDFPGSAAGLEPCTFCGMQPPGDEDDARGYETGWNEHLHTIGLIAKVINDPARRAESKVGEIERIARQRLDDPSLPADRASDEGTIAIPRFSPGPIERAKQLRDPPDLMSEVMMKVNPREVVGNMAEVGKTTTPQPEPLGHPFPHLNYDDKPCYGSWQVGSHDQMEYCRACGIERVSAVPVPVHESGADHVCGALDATGKCQVCGKPFEPAACHKPVHDATDDRRKRLMGRLRSLAFGKPFEGNFTGRPELGIVLVSQDTLRDVLAELNTTSDSASEDELRKLHDAARADLKKSRDRYKELFDVYHRDRRRLATALGYMRRDLAIDNEGCPWCGALNVFPDEGGSRWCGASCVDAARAFIASDDGTTTDG